MTCYASGSSSHLANQRQGTKKKKRSRRFLVGQKAMEQKGVHGACGFDEIPLWVGGGTSYENHSRQIIASIAS